MIPKTQYAKSGDVHIAYQVFGEGPINLAVLSGLNSHVELQWEDPGTKYFLEGLGAFARVVVFDKRGIGMSDRVPDNALPGLEQRMDDLRAVMDAAGMEHAAIYGTSEGSAMSILFAATYPERTDSLILHGGFAKRAWAPDYPYGQTLELRDKIMEDVERHWGRTVAPGDLTPEEENNPVFVESYLRYQRMSGSPGAMITLMKMNSQVDVREALPSVHVPTLILHYIGDPVTDIEGARYMAQRIPQAKIIEMPGIDHVAWGEKEAGLLVEIQHFLTGERPARKPDRVLATILFLDIVGSTEKVSQLGDQNWKTLLGTFRSIVRKELTQFGGLEIDTTGDGFLAMFDGPARAVRCTQAIRTSVPSLGLEIRAGVHAGEVELMGENIGGIAVHIGSRVMSKAGNSKVWVSSTVKDLTVGS